MSSEHIVATTPLVDRCLDRLCEYGLTSTVLSEAPDGSIRVRLQGRAVTQGVTLAPHRELTLTGLLRDGADLDAHHTIRIGERVSTRAADALRSRRVNFVDAAGNAYIDLDDWYIDVRGRRTDTQAHEAPPLRTPRNAFSTKRAQVIFAILQWEGLQEADVRTIAQVAGTSVGLAHRTLTELRHEVELWPSSPESCERLLSAWLAAYPTGLGAAHQLGRFRTPDVRAISGAVNVSGDPAVPHLLRPSEAIVYVDELTADLVARNRWVRDVNGNITVKKRFWRNPDATEVAEPSLAPTLLVLADLSSSPDPRRREAASALRATHAL
ncbi:type IV toxin-antitoxin system AbiEi family antitoxin [Microcella sp.]|uniref:type IV toxin-antitoxin system AbiEi family antitoxin n=1 Tax=Microcella sp. TaxID=1913979 RepID=UPI002568BB12|nr:type IV toxin-antitoxin system AbiEi family antitoxin [Microcella sp.]MBX9472980.1 hypothetical protein [Microcella sp.]